MATNLQIYEGALAPHLPRFAELLAKTDVPPERLMRTVLMSIERNPKLAACTMDSIVNAAGTAAVLALECDGVTGQAMLVPFNVKSRGKVAQLLIGYKGYNTLAWRAGYTVSGETVREGELFKFRLGTGAFVHYEPLLARRFSRPVIGAWAVAEAPGRSPIVAVIGIDEINAIKAKSKAANAEEGNAEFSPWNDVNGPGFDAMASKTAKRRLARSMPLNIAVRAAALETHAEELGRPGYLTWQRGEDPADLRTYDGAPAVYPDRQPERDKPVELGPPRYAVNLPDGSERVFPSILLWRAFMVDLPSKLRGTPEQIAVTLRQYREINGPIMAELHSRGDAYAEHVMAVQEAWNEALKK